jgi:hypothetical protein
MKTRKSLGTQGLRAGKYEIIVAYLVIPEDIDRELYIKECYRKQQVMMRDERGASWKRVFVAKSLLKELEFPSTSEERGSVLICNRVPKDSVPVVVNILDLKSTVSYIEEEKQWRAQRTFEGNVADIDMRAQEPSIDISVNSLIDDQGRINIKVVNPNDSAQLNILVKGDVNIEAQEKFTVSSDKQLELEIRDEDDEQIAHINYTKETGLLIEDEWGSRITMKEKSVMLKEAGGRVIDVTDQYVNLGSETEAGEFVALGETLKGLLEDLLDAIMALTVTTNAGPSGPPINLADFVTIRGQLSTILSQITKTD